MPARRQEMSFWSATVFDDRLAAFPGPMRSRDLFYLRFPNAQMSVPGKICRQEAIALVERLEKAFGSMMVSDTA